MAFIHDPDMSDALRCLVKGDPEPLASLIDEGRDHSLHALLGRTPGAREALSKALRTGKPRKRGKPHDREGLELRNWYLYGRIAYWIGRGMDDRWQDKKNVPDGDTVWHFAAAELPGAPMASTLQKKWDEAKRSPDAFTLLNMTHQFCHGVEHELADVDDPAEFLSRQWRKAGDLGLLELIYTPHLMRLHN